MNTRQDRLVTPLSEGSHGNLHLQTLGDALFVNERFFAGGAEVPA